MTRQGLAQPLYPSGRAIGPAPILRLRKLIEQTSFRMKLWETEREPTGAMKTKKKPEEKACFLSRLISFVFPGCTASGWRCSTAQPVGGCATPNSQSFIRSFAKGFLRVAVRASNSQKFNLSLQRGFCVRQCHTQFEKFQPSSAKACVRDAPFHRQIVRLIQIDISGTGCRVNDPAGVQGQSPAGIPFTQ